MQRQLSTTATPMFPGKEEEGENLEAKPEKAPPVQSSWAATERSIHLIPALTLLCFLVLFLCSHHPSPSDMEGFGWKPAAAGSGKPKSLGRGPWRSPS